MALSNTYSITLDQVKAYIDERTLLQLLSDDCDELEITEDMEDRLDILMCDSILQVENALRHNWIIPFSSLDCSLRGIMIRLAIVFLYRRRGAAPAWIVQNEKDELLKLERIIKGELEITGATRSRPNLTNTRR